MDEGRGATRHSIDRSAVGVEGQSTADRRGVRVEVLDRADKCGRRRIVHGCVHVTRFGGVRLASESAGRILCREMTGRDGESRATRLNLHGAQVTVGTDERRRRRGPDHRLERGQDAREFTRRSAVDAGDLGQVAVGSLGEQLTVRPEFVGRGVDPQSPRAQHRRRGRPRVLQCEQGHVRHGVHAEIERRHDAEIPTASSLAGPQQVGVGAFVGDDGSTVGRDDRHRIDVVGRESELASEDADAAAES